MGQGGQHISWVVTEPAASSEVASTERVGITLTLHRLNGPCQREAPHAWTSLKGPPEGEGGG